jgi:hypothetical protein
MPYIQLMANQAVRCFGRARRVRLFESRRRSASGGPQRHLLYCNRVLGGSKLDGSASATLHCANGSVFLWKCGPV